MDARSLAGDLLPRLRRWNADGWTVPTGTGTGTRASVAAATAQRLADLGADAEGRPRQEVPRLADTALADQLAVLMDDVLRTGSPAAAETAAAELAALRAALGYR